MGVACASLGLLSACTLVGCATSADPHASQGATTPQPRDARETLDAMAMEQSKSPDEAARALWTRLARTQGSGVAPVARIEDPRRLEQARRPLGDALAELTPVAPPVATPEEGPAPPQAQQLYASAMLMLASGDTAGAARELERATQLHATSGELWAALGRAQLRAGRRSTAIASLRRALDLGHADAGVLRTLAREEVRSGKADEALTLLLRARTSDDLRADAGLALAVDADAAQLLAERGLLNAARELLVQSLETPASAIDSSPSAADGAEVLRKRPQLLTLAGDWASAVGDDADAAELYARARRDPANLDPGQTLSRVLSAHLRAGRPASAALDLLDDIASSAGLANSAHESWVRVLAETSIGHTLADALASEASTLASGASPSTRISLARLAASAAPRERARHILAAALNEDASHPDLLADFCDAFDRSADRDAACAALAAAHPIATDAIAQALLESGVDVSGAIARLSRADAGEHAAGARVVASCMLRRVGLPQRALEVLGPTGQASEGAGGRSASASLAAAGALLAQGREPEARAALAWLLEDDGTHATGATEATETTATTRSLDPDRERFAVLAAGLLTRDATEREDDARRAVALAESLGATIDDCIRAAEACLANGDAPLARRMLDRALELDPRDERAHEALLSLLQPSGPLANERSLTEAVRRLRAQVPSSRALRWIVAQDLASRSAWKQAQSHLLDLIDDRGQPPEALALLLRAWTAPNDPDTLAQARALCEERLSRRPESAAWIIASSRLLLASGRAPEADDLLARAIARTPTEALLRQREVVVREGLGREAEADALIIQRLRAQRPTPDALLELAQLHLRRGEHAQVVASLAGVGPGAFAKPGDPAVQARLAALRRMLEGLTPESFATLARGEREQRLAVFDAIAAKLASPAPTTAAFSLARLDIVCEAFAEDSSRLAGDVARVVELYPALEDQAPQRVFTRLGLREDPSAALRFWGERTRKLPEGEQRDALARSWFMLVLDFGDAQDARDLVERVDGESLGRSLLGQVAERELPGEGARPASPDAWRAEVAHTLSNFAQLRGREALAESCHRLTLRHDPTHPWTSNDFGYMILERGGDLNEAALLIEQAYAVLSEEASVTDSLGWLRYRQGRLSDETDAQGNVVEGAVTLLRRAATHADGSDNWEVLDHLADALWRRNDARRGLGDPAEPADREEAVTLWRSAQRLLREAMAQRQLLERMGLARGDLLTDAMRTLQSKLEAAQEGKDPPIAALGIGPTFTPRPEPRRPTLREAMKANPQEPAMDPLRQ
jgi:tetratricopeptide (TPR) repeat protein